MSQGVAVKIRSIGIPKNGEIHIHGTTSAVETWQARLGPDALYGSGEDFGVPAPMDSGTLSRFCGFGLYRRGGNRPSGLIPQYCEAR